MNRGEDETTTATRLLPAAPMTQLFTFGPLANRQSLHQQQRSVCESGAELRSAIPSYDCTSVCRGSSEPSNLSSAPKLTIHHPPFATHDTLTALRTAHCLHSHHYQRASHQHAAHRNYSTHTPHTSLQQRITAPHLAPPHPTPSTCLDLLPCCLVPCRSDWPSAALFLAD